jgi:hypothetical protein
LGRAAEAGHGTVLVRAGRYPRVRFQNRTGPIAFRAAAGERPTVAGATIGDSSGFGFKGFRFTREVDLTNVSHCSFVGNVSPLRPAGSQTLSGYLVTGVSHAVWRGNTVTNGWIGIHFRGSGVRDVQIVDNGFERLGGQGIHLQEGDRVLVARNRFAGIVPRADMDPAAHADAVQTLGPSRNVTFDGNLVTRGRGFLIQFAPADEGLRAGQTGMVVQNNVFAGRDFSLRVFSAPGIRIVNNTVWGTQSSPGTGIDLRPPVAGNLPTTGAVLENNIVNRLYVTSATTYRGGHNLIARGPRKGPHDLRGTPRFLNSPYDWRLAPGSPGIRAGSAAGAPRRDRLGRPRSGRPDLGSDQS